LLDTLKDDPELKSLKSYKAMVKLYTHSAIHPKFAKLMPERNFHKIQTYLQAVILGTKEHSEGF